MRQDTKPEDLTDDELYEEYQHAKEHGPVARIDGLQLEIAQRWEAVYETSGPKDGAYVPEYDHEQVRVTCVECDFSRLYPLGDSPNTCHGCGGEQLNFEWPAEVTEGQ